MTDALIYLAPTGPSSFETFSLASKNSRNAKRARARRRDHGCLGSARLFASTREEKQTAGSKERTSRDEADRRHIPSSHGLARKIGCVLVATRIVRTLRLHFAVLHDRPGS